MCIFIYCYFVVPNPALLVATTQWLPTAPKKTCLKQKQISLYIAHVNI